MDERLRNPLKPTIIQRQNFFHLYFDIAWFGVLFGSTLSFLPVFITRLGAESWQLGILNAGPALVGIFATVYAGKWIQRQPLTRAVRLTIIAYRVGFLLLLPVPLLIEAAKIQIWTALILFLLMAIPGAALSISFDALLAAAVPQKWRGLVVGRRNAFLAVTTMVVFFGAGWLLDTLPFVQGYLAVFGIGAFGAVMSTYHVIRVRVLQLPEFKHRALADGARVAVGAGSPVTARRVGFARRLFLRWRPRRGLLADISPRYRRMMGAYFIFHFAQMLPAPLFPIFWVRDAHLSDGDIGLINALFFLTMFFGSLALGKLAARFGNHTLSIVGATLLAVYPLLTGLSQDLTLLIWANVVGGLVWGVLRGSLSNRLLDVIPENARPRHLAVYYFVANAALFLGTLMAPFLSDAIGLREAMFVITGARVLAGIVFIWWG